jgi:hypothetical protein
MCRDKHGCQCNWATTLEPDHDATTSTDNPIQATPARRSTNQHINPSLPTPNALHRDLRRNLRPNIPSRTPGRLQPAFNTPGRAPAQQVQPTPARKRAAPVAPTSPSKRRRLDTTVPGVGPSDTPISSNLPDLSSSLHVPPFPDLDCPKERVPANLRPDVWTFGRGVKDRKTYLNLKLPLPEHDYAPKRSKEKEVACVICEYVYSFFFSFQMHYLLILFKDEGQTYNLGQ